VFLIALALPATASAHAILLRTVPGDGSVLPRAPTVVRAVFDDTIEPGRGNEAIRDGGGSVLAGRPRAEGRTLVLPLRRGLTGGAYSVRWSIVSEDGHPESGVLAFAVGLGSGVPVSELAPLATQPTPGNVASRWFFLAGVLAAVGIALYALVARVRDERVALTLSSAAVVAALGAAEEAHRIGLDTRAGTALGAGFVAAVIVASLAGAATLERRALGPALVLALALAGVPSVSGHALDPGLNRVNIAVDVLHVLGAAAWVGALLGLVLEAPVRPAVVLAGAGVAVLAATGVVRASFELIHVSQLWTTSYGLTLIAKTLMLLVTLAVGWRLRARVRVRAGVELVLVTLLVIGVSVLVLLRPGRNEPRRSRVSDTAERCPTPEGRSGCDSRQLDVRGIGLRVSDLIGGVEGVPPVGEPLVVTDHQPGRHRRELAVERAGGQP